ncbi:MAG: 4-(cytidine 5'-diphospho)-2-C-methyl-D-erythritol kinase [Saccharofermentanales bacterium]
MGRERSYVARADARAKLNLSLKVLGRRPDGYHELDTWMATVALADRLSLCMTRVPEGGRVTLDVTGEGVPTDASNLACRAAAALFDAAGIDPGHVSLKMTLEKHIPVAAGLGGGSADAACVLRTLSRGMTALGIADLSRERVLAVADAVGADVPFLVEGGVRRCRGTGNVMGAPAKLPAWPTLIAHPPVTVSTPEAFRRLDQMRAAAEVPSIDVGDAPLAVVANDFLPVVAKRHEVIHALVGALTDAGAFACSMTGSGPTCFGLFETEACRDRAHRTLTAAHPEIRWIATSLATDMTPL